MLCRISCASCPIASLSFSSTSCDASGNGEGRTFLDDDAIVTDGSGDDTFIVVLGGGAPTLGVFLTITATDPDGNTSEFSPCFEVTS